MKILLNHPGHILSMTMGVSPCTVMYAYLYVLKGEALAIKEQHIMFTLCQALFCAPEMI